MIPLCCLRTGQSCLAALVTLLLLFPPSAAGQNPKPDSAAPERPQLPQPPLKLFVLEGQDANNFIPDRRPAAPVVEVRDENDFPIEGAEVRFQLPTSGPGGTFVDGQRTKVVKTNLQGQAEAPYLMNSEAGQFQIGVIATIGTRTGRTVITQTNSMIPEEKLVKKQNHRWYTNKKLLVIAGCAIIVGVVVLVTRNSGSSSTIVLTPGTPTFSAPH